MVRKPLAGSLRSRCRSHQEPGATRGIASRELSATRGTAVAAAAFASESDAESGAGTYKTMATERLTQTLAADSVLVDSRGAVIGALRPALLGLRAPTAIIAELERFAGRAAGADPGQRARIQEWRRGVIAHVRREAGVGHMDVATELHAVPDDDGLYREADLELVVEARLAELVRIVSEREATTSFPGHPEIALCTAARPAVHMILPASEPQRAAIAQVYAVNAATWIGDFADSEFQKLTVFFDALDQ